MKNSITPHNDFFYQVMSRKENAMTFFRRYLPKKALATINLETISLAESKHISDEGGSLYNDVLYRCEFNEGQRGCLFALCEHQSTSDEQMPLRLLKYNTSIIEGYRKQGQGKFPVIVLYHGRRPWNYATAFADYYAHPALGKEFLYLAPFTLINIPKMPRTEIQQDSKLGFCFAALRATSYPDPYEAFESTMRVAAFSTHFFLCLKNYVTW